MGIGIRMVLYQSGKTQSFSGTKLMSNTNVQTFCEDYDDILLADGFDDAFIGVGSQWHNPPIAIYDIEKCIDILADRDGMSVEDAREYFDFNVQGAWVGSLTPMFVDPFR